MGKEIGDWSYGHFCCIFMYFLLHLDVGKNKDILKICYFVVLGLEINVYLFYKYGKAVYQPGY